MKKFLLLLYFSLTCFALTACANNYQSQKEPTIKTPNNENKSLSTDNDALRIKITISNQGVIVRLNNTAASKDLLSMLPLTVTFKDYANTEKIAYLPRKLNIQAAYTNIADDFAYFAPWGNLAVFYKDKHIDGNGLIILGTIETNKHIFSNLNSDFTATIERLQE